MKVKNLILFLSLLFCSIVSAEIETLGKFKNTVAVQEVLNGKRKIANAAWWGFDKKDSTSALQGAVNSGAEKVIIPYMGSDWIVRPVKLASNQEIVFEPGVVVIAKKGEFKGLTDCLFLIYKSKNVTLRGYGATLKMRKKDYSGKEYKKAQWRHVIQFRGATNIKIFGLKLASSGGDGISIGSTQRKGYIPCRDILIKDCLFEDNYRQGISVGSVDKLRIDNCIFKGTSGHSPSAGIDFEPDDHKEMLSNIVVSNCISENNAGSGFMVVVNNLNSMSREISILIANCYVRSCYGPGLTVFGFIKENSPHGVIEFRNCTVERTVSPGIRVGAKTSSVLKIRFIDCNLKEVATNSSKAPIRLYFDHETETSKIEFENCYLYDNKNRSFMSVFGTIPGNGLFDIKGNINVHNKYGATIDSQSPFKSASLKIKNYK